MPNHLKMKIVFAVFAVFMISAILIEINIILGLFFLLFWTGFLMIVISNRAFSGSYVLVYDVATGEECYVPVTSADLEDWYDD